MIKEGSRLRTGWQVSKALLLLLWLASQWAAADENRQGYLDPDPTPIKVALDRSIEQTLVEQYERDLATARRSNQPQALVLAMHNLVVVYRHRRMYDKLQRISQEGIELSRVLEEPILRGQFHAAMGEYLARIVDDSQSSLSHFDRAVSLTNIPTYERTHFDIVNSRGLYKSHFGLYEAALEDLIEVSDYLERAHQSSQLSNNLTNIGLTYLRLQQLDLAAVWFRKAILMAAPEDESQRAISHALLGDVLGKQGKFKEAFAELDMAMDVSVKYGAVDGLAHVSRIRGETYLLAGQPERAAQHFEQALKYFRNSGEVAGTARVLVDLANLAVTEGDTDRAAALLAEVRALKLENPPLKLPELELALAVAREQWKTAFKLQLELYQREQKQSERIRSERLSFLQAAMGNRITLSQQQIEQQQQVVDEMMSDERRVHFIVVALLMVVVLVLGVMMIRALQLYRNQNETLAEISETDELTGALNRRGILTMLQAEVDSCNRAQKELSVILIDFDSFKYINDNFGHAAGDEVLLQFASVFKDVCRSVDRLGRLGGDEWLMLLPYSPLATVNTVLSRMRVILQKKMDESDFGDFPVGFSAGVVYLDGTETMTVDSVMERADAAMYRAKSRGANTTSVQLSPSMSMA